jgi:hypothetical protein
MYTYICIFIYLCISFSSSLDGPLHYLDRYAVDCDGKAVNQFHFDRKAKRLIYKCVDAVRVSLETDETKTTQWQDGGDSGFNFLDRHDLDCGEKKFLTYFHEETQDVKCGLFGRHDLDCKKKYIRFKYQCRGWSVNVQKCRDLSTPYSARGGDKDLKNLDAHNVKCAAHEGLRRFKVQSTGNSEKIKFDFKCCSTYMRRLFRSD